MKKPLLISTLVTLCWIMAGPAFGEDAEPADDTMKAERGYFFGYSFGNMLKEGGNVDVDLVKLMQGLEDSLGGTLPNLTPEQQESVIAVIREKQQEILKNKESEEIRIASENLTSAAAYLADNRDKDGVRTTKSGLQYELVSEGEGPRPGPTSKVVVHYEGKLVSGAIFDSSRARGTPAEFGLDQVIPGWTEGLQLMKSGEKAKLTIPPELAYGSGGTRNIPPNSVLIFEIELLEIK